MLADQVLITTLGFLRLRFGIVGFLAGPLLSAYRRRNATEDVALARRPICNGLPVAVLRRLARVNGLSRVAVDSRLGSERWTEASFVPSRQP